LAETKKFEWHLQPKFLLLVCAVLPITISAGFWQLDRAQYKIDILQQQDFSSEKPSVELTALEELENYVRVHIDGRWSDEVFLLDNRVRSGRVGYEVIGIFRADNLPAVLVNRGWVDGGFDRSILPSIDIPVGRQRIKASLYRSEQDQLVLADQLWSNSWPERIQALDFDLIEQRIGETVFASALRIDAESPVAYRADWLVERDGPEMHWGYAAQWFLMSFTLVVMTIFASSNLWEWLKQEKAR